MDLYSHPAGHGPDLRTFPHNMFVAGKNFRSPAVGRTPLPPSPTHGRASVGCAHVLSRLWNTTLPRPARSLYLAEKARRRTKRLVFFGFFSHPGTASCRALKFWMLAAAAAAAASSSQPATGHIPAADGGGGAGVSVRRRSSSSRKQGRILSHCNVVDFKPPPVNM